MTETRLYPAVARGILDMIDSGDYPPGARLPGERALADAFGVSRVVIREAQVSLEATGRVEVRPGAGVYAKDPLAANSQALPDVSALELTQTRQLFESECAAQAAMLITQRQISKLDAAFNEMARAPLGSAAGERADKAFHLLIAEATGNPANVYFLQLLWRIRTEIDSVARVYAAICHEDPAHRANEHVEILEALRQRDSCAARRAMQNHFARLLRALLDVTEQQDIEDLRRRADENRERFLQLPHLV